MRKIILLFFFISIFLYEGTYIFSQQPTPEDFSFIYMTDIHLEPGRRAPEGFKKAIDTANMMDADFVLTGGDMIADALEASLGRSDSLYRLYTEMMKEIKVPVYNTIGNHELCGLYRSSGVDTTHPDYYDGMYKRYFGNPYYSFDHKGWHFIVLESIIDAGNNYKGYIDSTQVEWLKDDLEKIDRTTPVIVSTHIPLLSTYGQISKGATAPNDEELIVVNALDILNILSGYNIKLILQGHLHQVEYIYLQQKVHFLVGGAVCAKWWLGPNRGMEEGFMYIQLHNGDVKWEYIDYGWEVAAQ